MMFTGWTNRTRDCSAVGSVPKHSPSMHCCAMCGMNIKKSLVLTAGFVPSPLQDIHWHAIFINHSHIWLVLSPPHPPLPESPTSRIPLLCTYTTVLYIAVHAIIINHSHIWLVLSPPSLLSSPSSSPRIPLLCTYTCTSIGSACYHYKPLTNILGWVFPPILTPKLPSV